MVGRFERGFGQRRFGRIAVRNASGCLSFVQAVPPVVTRTLQGSERAGLIAISENSEDARSRNVTLTLSGKAKLDEVLPGYFAILHRPDPAADK